MYTTIYKLNNNDLLYSPGNYTAFFPIIGYYSVSAAAAAAAKSLQSCPTLWDPIDGSHQAPPSLGFSKQEYWSGLPFPSPMPESEKWKVKSESEVPQSYPTLSDPMDCSLPGSSIHGIFQARVLRSDQISRVRLLATHGLQPTRLLHPWNFPGKNAKNPEDWWHQMLGRLCNNRYSRSLLVGMPNGTDTLKDSLMVSGKIKYILATWSSNHAPWYLPRELKTYTHTKTNCAISIKSNAT